jgi:hypothetical protein
VYSAPRSIGRQLDHVTMYIKPHSFISLSLLAPEFLHSFIRTSIPIRDGAAQTASPQSKQSLELLIPKRLYQHALHPLRLHVRETRIIPRLGQKRPLPPLHKLMACFQF